MELNSTHITESYTIDHASHHQVCWKSVAAGLFVTMLTMAALIGMGLAFGGMGLDRDTTAKGAGIFSGIWFLVSTILSVMAGSYYAARVSTFRAPKVGAANGLLIAALFLGFFLYQTFSAVGAIGRAAGAFVGTTATVATAGAAAASQNDQVSSAVSDLVEEQFAGLELRSDAKTVAMGVARRLMNENYEGAKNYLAYQTNTTPAEADLRIAQLRAESERMAVEAREAAATGMKSMGLSLLILTVLTALAGVGGGFLGSRLNMAHPMNERAVFTARHA